MPLHNTLDLLHPQLAKVYVEAKSAYKAAHPNGPYVPRLGETYREDAVQNAYYAQGRQPLGEINRLRALAGLERIGAGDGANKITNLKAGQGAHNYKPSRAFDVQLVNANGEPTWKEAEYAMWAMFVKAASVKLRIPVSIGAFWPKFKDFPHTELGDYRNPKWAAGLPA